MQECGEKSILAHPSQGAKGTLVPQGLLGLITTIPHQHTSSLPLPYSSHCASAHEENSIGKLGMGKSSPRGMLVSLCPQLPLPRGPGMKGALCMLTAGEEEDYCHHN